MEVKTIMEVNDLINNVSRMKQNIHIAIEKLELIKKEYLYYRDYLCAVDNALYKVLVEKNKNNGEK